MIQACRQHNCIGGASRMQGWPRQVSPGLQDSEGNSLSLETHMQLL